MDYYLPTTLKILRTYARLEAQEVDGENITATKERIEGMMDTVVEGFESQLDQLFRDEAIDITSDVQVLEHYGENHASSGHLYLVRLMGKDVEFRNEVINEMAKRGIACNVHYKPLPMMTAYKNLGFDIKDYPNAYNHFVNEITLPLHTSLTDDDVEYVIYWYLRILKEYI
jgi:dTDP-4-amino-4,6-dideoxygalactose transaminase